MNSLVSSIMNQREQRRDEGTKRGGTGGVSTGTGRGRRDTTGEERKGTNKIKEKKEKEE